ncbi:MAG: MerR family transcriptional regulator [Candidatus Omnitrophica bacterium]|jgi:MerR family transcriptional regulator/heat shock protein HspR|nr:MerR family transcriptional regulator [Candidatus Omnitrophota bacterium]MDD3275082.1 MerR family transcriptional regulator [Candidatus Omnitrophota bacterium]MDD5078542.1 MerR family transcriptional regulator [Candidatus Omnitrophota bacterium]MDD5725656.1 MerR family transcriptional regulator [Candidatus Omnitrophota bacterium]
MPVFRVRIPPEEPVYAISVVCRLVDIPVWTLRQLDRAGVVRPKRLGGKNRFYSQKDLKRLEYVRYLMVRKRVNIHGLKVILMKKE